MNPDRDPTVEPGGIIADRWGDEWKVLLVTDEHIFLQRIKPKSPKNVLHHRHIKWSDFGEGNSYWLVFP